ncbi:polysaccharide biosynthesis protein [Clostridium fermenticellae]|uniref:Polysaccharide biosynthesis protein n=1 Tax=Clostridium fermenticellae TaxID=2068654 RepID=A0A386H0Z0_9CLOT|nr:oligosaccharide flippase family protein [Clostridium fermenticellae]AYD39339.1 polysaccharide biosynthesis protein [Clostridium fermenticellae]
MERILYHINSILKKGFFSIFGAGVINKIVQFGMVIVIVRILPKDIYGSYAYAQNILSLFMVIQGLGAVPAILQFVSERDDETEKLRYFKYGLYFGICANFILCFIIIIFSLKYEFPIKYSNYILLKLSFLPLLSILYDIFQVYFRATLRNNEFSFISIVNTILCFIGNVVLGRMLGLTGIIIGNYIAYFLSILISMYLLKSTLCKFKSIKFLSLSEKKVFNTYAIITSLTNSISQILYIIDTFLVGMIIKNQEIVASYKAATQVPFALNFIPLSIMMFVYPYFAKNYLNRLWIREKYKMIQIYLSILNVIIVVPSCIFAPYIIKIIYGNNYSDCVFIFRVLMFGYFIAGTFRIPGGNVLASIRNVKINFYNSIISGIVNVLLDIYLIKKYGAIGAAYTTLIVFIISSIISNLFIYKYLRDK